MTGLRSRWSAFRTDALILAGLLGLFLASALRFFDSPGRLFDSTRTVNFAAQMAESWSLGNPLPALTGYPLYHGCLDAYLLFPFFAAWEPRIWMVRALALLSALAALGVGYLFLRGLFNRTVAAAAVLLWALNPSYLMAVKVYQCGSPVLSLYTMGCLLFLHRWWRSGRMRDLALAAFAAGLGLGMLLWYLWFLAAVAALAAFFWKDLRRRLGPPSPRRLAGLCGTVLLGLVPALLPILTYEISRGFPSFSNYLAASDAAGRLGAASLVETARVFGMVLDSSHYFREYFQETVFRNSVYVWLFAAAGLWSLFGGFRDSPFRVPARFLALLFLLMLVQAAFTPPLRALDRKLFILYPIPQALLAAAAYDLAVRARSRVAAPAACAAFALLLLSEARGLATYHARMAHTGPLRSLTDQIRPLAAWLKTSLPEARTVLFSECHTQELVEYTEPALRGRLDCLSPKGLVAPEPRIRLFERLAYPDPSRVCLVLDTEASFHGPLPEMLRRRVSRDFSPARVFADPDGVAIFETYCGGAVRPEGAGPRPPSG